MKRHCRRSRRTRQLLRLPMGRKIVRQRAWQHRQWRPEVASEPRFYVLMVLRPRRHRSPWEMH